MKKQKKWLDVYDTIRNAEKHPDVRQKKVGKSEHTRRFQ
jgi:hypothetical protein